MSLSGLSPVTRTVVAVVLLLVCHLFVDTCEADFNRVVARDLVLPSIDIGKTHAEMRVIALANADFDEDGVPDLVVGLSGDGVFAVAVYTGNVDAIYPHSPQARTRREQGAFTDVPFAAAPRLAPLNIAPDFVVTGDLDNDGHWDVAAAALGGTEIEWFRGNGTGGLLPAGSVSLPGQITAVTAGEVNRRDGIEDFVVAVTNGGSAQLVVYESPLGALRGAPEIHALPTPVTDLTIGMLGSWMPSIAAVTGSELVVVHGRDRRLSLGASQRAAVAPARIDRIPLPADGVALSAAWPAQGEWQDLVALLADGTVASVAGSAVAAGALPEQVVVYEGTEPGPNEKAVLIAARCTTSPGDDLFVIDPDSGGMYVVELSQPTLKVNRFPVTASGVALAAVDMRLTPAAMHTLLVPSLEGPLTLTWMAAPIRSTYEINDNDDDPDYAFDGVCETAPGSGDCTLRAAIQEANATTGPHTISFAGLAAGDHTIFLFSALPPVTQTVTIDGTTHPDGMVEIDGTVAGDVDALTLNGEGGNCAVRGLAIHSFEGSGIVLLAGDSNIVEGCHLGTNIEGTVDLGNNDDGIRIEFASTLNQIGGTAPGARNVVAGNRQGLNCGSGNNAVEGNYIGTDATGSVVPGYQQYGIRGGCGTIGGPVVGAGNVVSGNGTGVALISNNLPSLILGNLIGTDATGTADLGNAGHGMSFDGWALATVGSTAANGGNVISGNDGDGVYYFGGAADHIIQNNLVGTDISGTAIIGNRLAGIEIAQRLNTFVGGSVPNAGNVVSGNGAGGVAISNGSSNSVLGNFIGTDATASVALANGAAGVAVWNSDENMIGGAASGEGNVISGNALTGVKITSGDRNSVIGNLIGTDSAATVAIPNLGHGVMVSNANLTVIGGSADGEGNLIGFNGSRGVLISDGGIFNAVQRNDFVNNGGIAIDLDGDGATANDPGDADTGTNRLINYPEIFNATILPTGELEITYTVDCLPGSADYDLRIEFFAADGDGPGATLRYLGFDTYTTSDHSAGSATTLVGDAASLGVDWDDRFAATTTDELGNSSEVGSSSTLNDAIFADGFESGDVSAWSGVGSAR